MVDMLNVPTWLAFTKPKLIRELHATKYSNETFDQLPCVQRREDTLQGDHWSHFILHDLLSLPCTNNGEPPGEVRD